MRSTLSCALLALAVLPGAGCTDLGVGRKCLAAGEVMATQISLPALECMSRLCYLRGDSAGNVTRSVCTARCTTDEDCADGLTSNDSGLCPSNFVCAIGSPVNLGPPETNFACQAICLCKDDLERGFNADSTDLKACCPADCRDRCPTSLKTCT